MDNNKISMLHVWGVWIPTHKETFFLFFIFGERWGLALFRILYFASDFWKRFAGLFYQNNLSFEELALPKCINIRTMAWHYFESMDQFLWFWIFCIRCFSDHLNTYSNFLAVPGSMALPPEPGRVLHPSARWPSALVSAPLSQTSLKCP